MLFDTVLGCTTPSAETMEMEFWICLISDSTWQIDSQLTSSHRVFFLRDQEEPEAPTVNALKRQVIELCTGSSLHLHSKRVVTYNRLYRRLLAAVKYATTTMYSKCRQRCSEEMPMVTVKSPSISAGPSHLKLSRSLKDQYWMTARTPGLMASLLLNANYMLLPLRPLLSCMLWSLVVHNLHRHA